MKKAVILFSGGLDSTTCAYIAKSQRFEPHLLSFDYAQKHNVELLAAKRIASSLKAHHTIFNLDINQFGGSSLTDSNLNVPDYDTNNTRIPNTYVPARNTIFLSIALALAETLSSKDIFTGVSEIDYSGYPDCRPEYIAAFQKLANLATKMGVEEGGFKIHTPLIHLSKAEIVTMGTKLGIDYSQTVSCYRADEQGHACGKCDSCSYRKKGFLEAGMSDPTKYY